MKRLLIVRHGQKTETGNFNPSHRKKLPLTRLGVNQMKSLGLYLKQLSESSGIAYSKIVSSDFLRANQSAQILSEILNVDPMITDARLGERVLFPEVCEDEQLRQYTIQRAWKDWDYAPEGGESLNSCYNRYYQALADCLAETGKNETVIIVTHGRVTQTYIYKMFPQKFPQYRDYKMQIPLASVRSLIMGHGIVEYEELES